MRTEIATLGEFGLIDHLTEGIKLENESSKYGVGDDAAVLSYPSEKQVLVTTDLLMEGVHFDLTYVPLKHLGYKAAVVNFSDIYAMNGTPRQITVSIALSKRFSVEDMDDLYAGIRLACQQYNVDIVGGDTTSSLTGLAISITCIGDADKDKVVYRNGAKETDLICVSGDLGAAYMGLQLLEREKVVLKGEKDVQPDFVKTSTGFGTGGATEDVVRLMKKTVGSCVNVKAAGGIRDWETCAKMIDAGAVRIGTSSSIKILEEFEDWKRKKENNGSY